MSEYLPEQIRDMMGGPLDPSQPTEGEKSLGLALIMSAVIDMVRARQKPGNPVAQKLADDAREWVQAAERAECGFGWACGKASIPPERLSWAILSWASSGPEPVAQTGAA